MGGGEGVGGTACAESSRAGQRDISLESQRKVPRAAGCTSGRVPPWPGGPSEVEDFFFLPDPTSPKEGTVGKP